MSARKRFCDLCNDRITTRNWERHTQSENHLKNWARREDIHGFQTMKASDIEKIKCDIEANNCLYSVYGLRRLQELAAERGLEIDSLGKGTREKIVKWLHRAEDKKNKKLHIYSIDKIREMAAERGISQSEKTKEELIKQIFGKKGLSYCKFCRVGFQDQQLHDSSEKHCMKTGTGLEEVVTLTKTGKFKAVVYNNVQTEPCDIPHFLEWITRNVAYGLSKVLKDKRSLKMFMSLECEYVRDLGVRDAQLKTLVTFHTKNEPFFMADDLKEVIGTHFRKLLSSESSHQPNEGSGWSFNSVKRLIVKTAKVNPINASSYIDLPNWVKNKKAVINVKNTSDNLCFAYSLSCAIREPPQSAERPIHYKDMVKDPIFQNFAFPMKLSDIAKFELNTQSGEFEGWPSMAICVFEIGQGKQEILPVRVSKFNKTAEKIVDLLLVDDGSNQHYALIKDLAKLVRSQLTKHRCRIWLCRLCLSHFYSEEKLNIHEKDCGEHRPSVTKMPMEGSTVRFKNFIHKFQHPFVIYADFETKGRKLNNDFDSVTTTKLKLHVPYGFAIYLVSRVNGDGFNQPIVYRARSKKQLDKVPFKFIDKLDKILLAIAKRYKNPKPLDLSDEEEEAFRSATSCHICEAPFIKNDKVRDHSHLEGFFLGAAHQSCNLARSVITKIPVVMHNMSNFDSHLFVEDLFHYYNNSKMTVLANSEEKYICLEKFMFQKVTEETERRPKYYKLCFIDSFRFLSASLEKLSENLSRSQMVHLNHFINNGMRKYLRMNESRAFQILRGKGVFPYDFVDDLSKLKHNSLLEKSHFYDTLNDEEITDSDYYKYKYLWHCLKNKTLGSYSDLYNIQDVLLLADIFENFRNVSMENYQLDPAYYLTAPSLAWDAMLKKTKSEIGLVSDQDMYLMLERGIRGGIAQVCKRYAAANNKYLGNFDETKPVNYLMYFDACNLYGWALSQSLPYNDFKWVEWSNKTVEEIRRFVLHHSEGGPKGYILEVDLDYPPDLHNDHKDVPFGACHYNNKLCTTLHEKQRYIVHINNLKQMLEHGLVLLGVHRVIQFTQNPFMKPYIEFNSMKRQKAQNEFEKNFYKLMVNSVFGRTMMNLRKRQNIKLCTEAQASKWAKKPSFCRWTIFNEDFLACHFLKNRLYLNQPIQIGCAVLDISKGLMYKFFYEKLKVWDPSVKLILMDTDSYLVEMSRDPYKIIEENLDDFDTSNYPQGHPLCNPRNKNVPGKMKDELGGQQMTEVCGLRAKLYNYSYSNKQEIRCKGVKRKVAEKSITMKRFKEALFEGSDLYTVQTNIRSVHHVLYTESQRKRALNANDDKRYILENKIDTLPWGHRDIPPEVIFL